MSSSTPTNAPGAMDILVNNFHEKLKASPIYPALWGYYGWNYESAVAVDAIQYRSAADSDETHTEALNAMLLRALKLPHAGYFMTRTNNALWLYSVGDRIGLFGCLYKEVNEQVYLNTIEGVLNWPKSGSVFTRAIGWGFLFGFRPYYCWVWADDVFMGGIPLIKAAPEKAWEMLQGAEKLLRCEKTQLWWHGVKIDHKTGIVKENNGIKWGRAHAWILLTYARYAAETGEAKGYTALAHEVNNTIKYQRDTGAFGNIVDAADSPDESSLTTAFVYAVAVLNAKKPVEASVFEGAKKAWTWLQGLKAEGLTLSRTAGACHLCSDAQAYNKVVGVVCGPAVAFSLWAKLGADMLKL